MTAHRLSLATGRSTTTAAASVADRKVHIAAVSVALVLLAFGVRLFHIGASGWWYDEMRTIEIISNLAQYRDVHPPLYYYAVAAWSQVFGSSEFAVRIFSVLTGTAITPLMYAIGSRFLQRRAAIAAALLSALAPLLLWHSQDARMYILLCLFSLLQLYFYMRFLSDDTLTNRVLVIVFGILMLYTHIYAALMLVALSIHVGIFERRRLPIWAVLLLIWAAAYVPYLLHLATIPPITIGTERGFNTVYGLYTYFAFIAGYSLGPSVNDLRSLDLSVVVPHLPVITALAIVTSVLALTGIYRLVRTHVSVAALLIIIVVFPVAAAVAAPLLRSSMTFNVRYVIFSAPVLLLIVAAGTEYRYKGWHTGYVLLALLIGFSIVSIANRFYNPAYFTEDVRAAASYVAANAEAHDTIVVVTVGSTFRWYFEGDSPVFSNQDGMSAVDLLHRVREAGNRVWLVQARAWQTDPDETIRTYLEAAFLPVTTVHFPGVLVTEYCLTECNQS